ncbi:hypothetical protein F53441_14359 [Fusarium austroafricanum]|uniref:Uncharacterized protein n=1 Tax=Fusarium austroafricanum TaxID=2364996 RepID=A0A8H4JF48_9HYPO|nr:hypothetical protein F53441_14359 [Fusarium austroafricanum]
MKIKETLYKRHKKKTKRKTKYEFENTAQSKFNKREKRRQKREEKIRNSVKIPQNTAESQPPADFEPSAENDLSEEPYSDEDIQDFMKRVIIRRRAQGKGTAQGDFDKRRVSKKSDPVTGYGRSGAGNDKRLSAQPNQSLEQPRSVLIVGKPEVKRKDGQSEKTGDRNRRRMEHKS